MRKFTFWYKKEIEAPSLEKGNKDRKETPLVLSSVEHTDEPTKGYTSCIGFQINTESDEWED